MAKTDLKTLLSTVRNIALVGASQKTHRPSYEVMHYLQEKGFKVYPINPALAGKKILNEQVYARLEDLPENVDMVEIFRNSEAAGETCLEVLALPLPKQPKIVWMQIGVINEQAASQLRNKNLTVVMNECPKRVLSN